ncbi:MAG: hypothetical protein ABWY45_25755 [Mycobacterium sp.]
MSADAYTTTRIQLRGIAESAIAGPQHRVAGTIRLAVRPAGFIGTAISVEVQGTDLLWQQGRIPLTGSLSTLAEAAGLQFGPPTGVYDVTEPLAPDTELTIDPASAQVIYRSLYAGAQALITFAEGQHPVLWPEHFDVAVTVGEANYGVSPGDSYHPRPYAYVGPWTPRAGAFWNAPFGALLSLDVAAAETTLVADVAAFFSEGRRRLQATRTET